MSLSTHSDSLSDFRRRWWWSTVRRRSAEAPLLIPIAAYAGFQWGGWWGAIAAGGAMLTLLGMSIPASFLWLMGAFANDLRHPPARWPSFFAWAGSSPAMLGLAACGYLTFGWVGASALGVGSAIVFALATLADLRVRCDAHRAIAESERISQPG